MKVSSETPCNFSYLGGGPKGPDDTCCRKDMEIRKNIESRKRGMIRLFYVNPFLPIVLLDIPSFYEH